MANVTLHNARKSFGSVEIIKGVDLEVADGEFCVFVGPSGCGKSTLLRMIAGLEEFTSGDLRIGGQPMANVQSADRGVAMVFQSYALYPHMTVRENISFGLKMAKMPADQIAARVKHASDMLQLEPLLERKPSKPESAQAEKPPAVSRQVAGRQGSDPYPSGRAATPVVMDASQMGPKDPSANRRGTVHAPA